MKPLGPGELRADLISAWAVACGVGLIVLMVAWLVGNRLFGLLLEPPQGPAVAFGTAVALGIVTTTVIGKRLAATIALEVLRADHDSLNDQKES